MDSKQLAQRCRQLAENRKAEKVVVLDVRKLSSVTDFFVIATGLNEPHVRAIVEEVTEKLVEEAALRPRAQDGSWKQNWVALDYFDVIVHVMRPEARSLYALESLWNDAPRVRRPPRPRAPRTLPA
ncbi:MAG: ribosome silencing factor [Verrucomicrobiales bacterium]|nr:ribosome silencing factor [Verrucomicrobiales bacterium]